MKSFVGKDIKSNNEQRKNYIIMTTFIKYTLVILLFLMAASGLKAQVGIGTIDPDTSVILDIQSPSKGVLLPRIATLSVKGIEGALIYFPDSAKFKYYHNGAWISVNPLKNDVNDNVTAPGTLKVLGSSVYAPNADSISSRKATIIADKFVGSGTIPLGGIIMWSGKTPPPGWALCDGTILNGYTTPNLSGRFVVSYDPTGLKPEYNNPGNLSNGSSLAPGDTGGKSSLTLASSNIPGHQHTIGTGPGATLTDGSHEHKLRIPKRGYIFGENGGSQDYTTYDDGVLATIFSTTGGGGHTHTGLTGYAGGVYTYDSFVNPPYLNPPQNSFEYTFTVSSQTFYANNDMSYYGTDPTTTTHFSAIPNGTSSGYTIFKIWEVANSDGALISDQSDDFISNHSNDSFSLHGVTTLNNQSYDGTSFTNPAHVVGYDDGAVIISNQKWSAQPIDIRPAYYVLAFIMRIK